MIPPQILDQIEMLVSCFRLGSPSLPMASPRFFTAPGLVLGRLGSLLSVSGLGWLGGLKRCLAPLQWHKLRNKKTNISSRSTSPIHFGESSTTMGWIWKQVNKNIYQKHAIKRPWVDVWSWLLRVQQNGDDNWNKTCLKHTKLTSQLVLLVVGLRLSSLVLKLYVLTFLNNGMVMSVWDNPFHNTINWLKVQLSLTRLKISSSSQDLPYIEAPEQHDNSIFWNWSEKLDCKLLQDLDTQTIHIYIDV